MVYHILIMDHLLQEACNIVRREGSPWMANCTTRKQQTNAKKKKKKKLSTRSKTASAP